MELFLDKSLVVFTIYIVVKNYYDEFRRRSSMVRKGVIFLILSCFILSITGCSNNDYISLYDKGKYDEALKVAIKESSKYNTRLNQPYSSIEKAKQDATALAKAYYYQGLCYQKKGNSPQAKAMWRLAAKTNYTITQVYYTTRQVYVEGKFENKYIPGHYQQKWVPGHYEQKWIEGHYENKKVWVDGHFENGVWIDGHYEYKKVWVDGYYDEVWVDGRYESVWVDGYYVREWVPGHYETVKDRHTKEVTITVSNEWIAKARALLGETGQESGVPAVATDNELSLLKQQMDAARIRYEKFLAEGKKAEAEKAKEEWLKLKKKYEILAATR